MHAIGGAWLLTILATAAGQAPQPNEAGPTSSLFQVAGRITRVGLGGSGAPLIRTGEWSFVEVELATRGGGAFTGLLEVRQADLDGDLARYQARVALAPNAGPRTYRVYFVPDGRGATDAVRVRLLDESGRVRPITDESAAGQTPASTRNELVSSPLTPIDSEIRLIADLSSPPVALLGYVPPRRDPSGRLADDTGAWRTIRLDARSVPDSGRGLEPVDAIVWDDADPASLSPAQVDALTDWVRHGGRLVLTAGRNWQTLNGPLLSHLLPARIEETIRVDELQEFAGKIVRDDACDLAAYYKNHPVVRCRMKPRPESLPIPSDPQRLAGLDPAAYRRPYGRGMVVLVGASLRDLLAPIPLPRSEPPESAGNQPDPEADIRAAARAARADLLRVLLGVPDGRGRTSPGLTTVDLFDRLRATIGFQASGALYLLTAVVFATAYTTGATIGSWWWLRRRRLLHHGWTAFTLCALAGSAAGGLFLGSLRGVRMRIEQATVVDGVANSVLASAYALFGVKTPAHQALSLRLPTVGLGDDGGESRGVIRTVPNPGSEWFAEPTFATPESYLCSSDGTVIDRWPVRATLKQVEGQWEGALPGRLEARLVLAEATSSDGRIEYPATGTFIRNRLGVDLRRCVLLKTSSETAVDPARIECHELGDLPARGAGAELDEGDLRRLFVRPAGQRPDGDGSGPADALAADSAEVFLNASELPTLATTMTKWAANTEGLMALTTLARPGAATATGRRFQAEQALLMLSAHSLLPYAETGAERRSSFRAGHGRRLDRMAALTRDTALLFGFADDPSPVSLHVDGAPPSAVAGWTAYRFVLPVERRGASRHPNGS